jgi:hypothetical protein
MTLKRKRKARVWLKDLLLKVKTKRQWFGLLRQHLYVQEAKRSNRPIHSDRNIDINWEVYNVNFIHIANRKAWGIANVHPRYFIFK